MTFLWHNINILKIRKLKSVGGGGSIDNRCWGDLVRLKMEKMDRRLDRRNFNDTLVGLNVTPSRICTEIWCTLQFFFANNSLVVHIFQCGLFPWCNEIFWTLAVYDFVWKQGRVPRHKIRRPVLEANTGIFNSNSKVLNFLVAKLGRLPLTSISVNSHVVIIHNGSFHLHLVYHIIWNAMLYYR